MKAQRFDTRGEFAAIAIAVAVWVIVASRLDVVLSRWGTLLLACYFSAGLLSLRTRLLLAAGSLAAAVMLLPPLVGDQYFERSPAPVLWVLDAIYLAFAPVYELLKTPALMAADLAADARYVVSYRDGWEVRPDSVAVSWAIIALVLCLSATFGLAQSRSARRTGSARSVGASRVPPFVRVASLCVVGLFLAGCSLMVLVDDLVAWLMYLRRGFLLDSAPRVPAAVAPVDGLAMALVFRVVGFPKIIRWSVYGGIAGLACTAEFAGVLSRIPGSWPYGWMTDRLTLALGTLAGFAAGAILYRMRGMRRWSPVHAAGAPEGAMEL